jgi:hypothetical protein
MKIVSERRPYLALFVDEFLLKALEVVTGHAIFNREYGKIKLHVRWLGPLKPVPKVTHSRCHVPTSLTHKVMFFLDVPTSVQKYAYGTNTEIEHVDRLERARTLAARLIQRIDEEITASEVSGSQISDSAERCQKTEELTFRRCMCERAHSTKQRRDQFQ